MGRHCSPTPRQRPIAAHPPPPRTAALRPRARPSPSLWLLPLPLPPLPSPFLPARDPGWLWLALRQPTIRKRTQRVKLVETHFGVLGQFVVVKMADARGSGSRKRPNYDVHHKRSVGRQAKRKFRGNRFTKQSESQDDEQPDRPSSASRRKLSWGEESAVSYSEDGPSGYRVVSWACLRALENIIVCKECHGGITFHEENVRGLGFKLVLKCSRSSCKDIKVSSSCMIGKQNNAYEVNSRAVLGMRSIGQGLSAMQQFCWIMDMPCLAQPAFDAASKNLKDAAKSIAEDSMARACKKEEELTGSREVYVSGDGSWRKKGFTSLQGVATVIGNRTGQVVDFEAKQSYCKECELWERKCGTEEYFDWIDSHIEKCQANHEGSSGKMEVDAIVEIFKRSKEKHGVLYKYYIGDGDCKTFKEVCDANPYDDVQVIKKECVGHVEKRFGTAVRNLKDQLKGKQLEDGKGLTGVGRLTGKWIDRLQEYYGNAIRENSDSVPDMRNAIWATYFHYISTDSNPQHSLCPLSWCKWKQAKEERKLRHFKHSHDLPVVCMKALKPVYDRLSSLDLLERCLGGFTQNANESVNNKIWQILPKRTFSGLATLQFGVSLAVSIFNDGSSAVLDTLKEIGAALGSYSISGALRQDSKRVSAADRKALHASLEARKKRRRERLEEQEANKRAEGALYGAGEH